MNRIGRSQRKTIELMIQGYARKEIAHMRGISHSTIRNHTMRARVKLGCRTVEQMMFVLGKEGR